MIWRFLDPFGLPARYSTQFHGQRSTFGVPRFALIAICASACSVAVQLSFGPGSRPEQ
jgi:hypothetical protein